jgi:dTDP-4-dehydrorhamnose reductase
MKILLLGREGQVAWELRRSLAAVGDVVAVDRRTAGLTVDLANLSSLRRAIGEVRPHLIVNAAAYTAVDKAEQETELAWRINAEAPGVIATEAARIGAGLIHYSTDYVFGENQANEPYPEHHQTAPQSVYGRSKLAGEEAIQSAGVPHVILRTAWVYGRRGHNFLLTMLRLLRDRDVVKVVEDQRGAPTWSRHIADATALLAVQCRTSNVFRPESRSGIYHLTCSGETSWHGFAERICTDAQRRGLLGNHVARLEGIPTSGYPTAAQRPAYSVLANDKLAEAFGLRLPAWEDALGFCLDEFCKLT